MKELKKGFDPSPSRIWYNDWVSKNVNGYEDNIDFKDFKILEKKDFDNKYHYIICTK